MRKDRQVAIIHYNTSELTGVTVIDNIEGQVIDF